MIFELTQGEILQSALDAKSFENLPQSLEILSLKTYQKTGSLFDFGLNAVPIIHNQSAKVRELFSALGTIVGLYFQHVDDVLDQQVRPTINKEPYKDIKDGIVTINCLTAYFLKNNSSKKEGKNFLKLYFKKDKTEEEIHQLIATLNSAEVLE